MAVLLVECQTCKGPAPWIKEQEEDWQCPVKLKELDQDNLNNPRDQVSDLVFPQGDLTVEECMVQYLNQECTPTFPLSNRIQALLQWDIQEPLLLHEELCQLLSSRVLGELLLQINLDLVLEWEGLISSQDFQHPNNKLQVVMAEQHPLEANLEFPFQDRLMGNLVMEEGFHLAPNLATI